MIFFSPFCSNRMVAMGLCEALSIFITLHHLAVAELLVFDALACP
jgi:hypothetical protein